MKIYLDNASTTLIDAAAKDAMFNCMDVYGNPSSIHFLGEEARDTLKYAKKKIALALGCNPDEIIITSGGSEADNQAIQTAAEIGKSTNKKHIITTSIEHPAILEPLKALEADGFEVTYLPVNTNGTVSAEDFIKAIRDDTVFASVMTVNNEIGTIQPINEIGKISKSKGIIFHTDSVQAIGHIDIRSFIDNVDMLSLSAHKFHGPRGIGLLYCRSSVPVKKFINGGHQEHNKRAGTENIPGIVGMSVALEKNVAGIEKNNFILRGLESELLSRLRAIPGFKMNGNPDYKIPGLLNFSYEGVDGHSLLLYLSSNGICVSNGSACLSNSLEPSHVIMELTHNEITARNSIRISMSDSNTIDEIKYVAGIIKEYVNTSRSDSSL